MTTPVPPSARARMAAAVEYLAERVRPDDVPAWAVIDAWRALEAELAGGEPIFAEPSMADPVTMP